MINNFQEFCFIVNKQCLALFLALKHSILDIGILTDINKPTYFNEYPPLFPWDIKKKL